MSIAVPSAVPTPRDRVVYVPASQMNFDLSVEVTSPSASDFTVEWRLNNVPIPTTGYIVTTRNGILTSQRVFSLTILTFDPSVHAGVYELVVTGSAGSAVSATWEVREAGALLYNTVYKCVGNNVTGSLCSYSLCL